MVYDHTLRYAGSAPFEPEDDREDIPWTDMEMLEQDDTYRRLAEVRFLAEKLSDDVDGDGVPDRVQGFVDDAVDYLDGATTEYADEWMGDRDGEGGDA